MKKENYVYTEKDIYVGFQFIVGSSLYEVTSIDPFRFKKTDSETIHKDWTLIEAIARFNDSYSSWTPIIPKFKNIELWI
jgi:hypothetical protein